MKERMGKVPMFLGASELQLQVEGDAVRLSFKAADGERSGWPADHVILATGYKVDLRRLDFLSEAIRSQLRAVENTPILSANFESSVPGLYFVGLAAANTFGPLMRFAYGAEFTARRLSAHLLRNVAREARRRGTALQMVGEG